MTPASGKAALARSYTPFDGKGHALGGGGSEGTTVNGVFIPETKVYKRDEFVKVSDEGALDDKQLDQILGDDEVAGAGDGDEDYDDYASAAGGDAAAFKRHMAGGAGGSGAAAVEDIEEAL